MRNDSISYELRRHPRARHLRVAVHPGGQVVVTIPRRLALRQVEPFVRQNRDWIIAQVERMRDAPASSPGEDRREYLALREEARAFVLHRLTYYRHVFGYDFGRVSIRNQTTRWGSCSRDGNLSFNYKIVTLPPDQADYIVVHELCHRVEFNHSAGFWSLVAKAVPHYKKVRSELRKRKLAHD